MLCAPIKTDSIRAIAAANRKADLIELRLDLFTPKNLSKLRQKCTKPVIFKLQKWDPHVLSFSPDYVDLPFGVEADLPVPRICSFHDQKRTPDLDALFEKMQKTPAPLYKIATFARSTSDSLRMLDFVRRKKCIGLCMGELGKITRILAPIFGSPWTYAPLNQDQKTAPGQVLLDELIKIYRYPTLSSATALYGLIGDPIDQSLSHKMHNFAFEQLKIDAVYVKMNVKKEELPTFLPLARQLGFRGLSVTMPLKEAIGEGEAINTIGFQGGEMRCWNTDGIGALNALEKTGSVLDKRIVILGAGGSAIAIAKEAKIRGAHVVIANRTLERALKIDADAVSLSDYSSKDYDILINCTPTHPVSDESLLPGKIVMDIRSRPKMTPFLQAAQKKGCTLVYGIDMFIQQAIGQYCHWFVETQDIVKI